MLSASGLLFNKKGTDLLLQAARSGYYWAEFELTCYEESGYVSNICAPEAGCSLRGGRYSGESNFLWDRAVPEYEKFPDDPVALCNLGYCLYMGK